MVEDHRRVEPRSIVGTGMVNDPERLEKIGEEAARRERASRERPAAAFGEVLGSAPARGALIDDVEPDPRAARADADTAAASDAAASDGAPDAAAAAKNAPKAQAAKKPTSSKPLPSLPDPRERLLRQKLAQLEQAAPKKPLTSSETPPTGNSRMLKK